MGGKAFSASLWILSATELQLGATIAPSEGSGAEDCLASFLPVIKDNIFPVPGERDLTATTSKEDLVGKKLSFCFQFSPTEVGTTFHSRATAIFCGVLYENAHRGK